VHIDYGQIADMPAHEQNIVDGDEGEDDDGVVEDSEVLSHVDMAKKIRMHGVQYTNSNCSYL
jgi:hypothetical protein